MTYYPNRKLRGFTLLEMSVVLVIISIVSIGLIEIFAATVQKAQFKQTVVKMEAIQKALYEYRLAFNRLPCPADATIALNAAYFGIEASVPGDCYNGGAIRANYQQASVGGGGYQCSINSIHPPSLTVYVQGTAAPPASLGAVISDTIVTGGYITPGSTVTSVTFSTYSSPIYYWTVGISGAILKPGGGGNCVFSAGSATSTNVEGMVPTKTLGLPDEYAFDGWGRRIMYAVSNDITQNGAFSAISAYDSATRMTVNSAEHVAKSTQAVEVLISFGQNGHGAYPRNGGATRVSVGSINADELNNCDCDKNAAAQGFGGVFVQKDLTVDSSNPLNNFDDIVYFSTRIDYLRPANVMAQPFTTDAGGGSQLNGNGMCPGGGLPSCTVTNGVKICQCPY